eukprot:scaffold22640_cov34-Phaeocystis_antarctica.AAC.2
MEQCLYRQQVATLARHRGRRTRSLTRSRSRTLAEARTRALTRTLTRAHTPNQVVKLQLSGRVLDEHTLESAFSTDELKAFWRPMLSSQADAPLLDATFIER